MSEAKEKAKELFDRYMSIRWDIGPDDAKQCALIAVEQILENGFDFTDESEYWQEVKTEIEKL